MKTKLLIPIIAVIVIAIITLSILQYLQTGDTQDTKIFIEYDSFDDLLISNSQTMNGVQLFLERYPDANIIIGKGLGYERHNVLYRVDIPSEREGLTNEPFVILNATMTPEGFPEDLEMKCSNGIELFIMSGKNNVESSLRKMACENEIPELMGNN